MTDTTDTNEELSKEELIAQVDELNQTLENHTVITKTPLHDLSWWIKWVSAVVGILGAMLTAAEVYPWNVVLGFISLVGWSYVGILWNDRAIIVMNIFLAGVYSLSLINTFKEVMQ